MVAATFLSFFPECVLRFVYGTGVTAQTQICEKKVAAVELIFCMVEELVLVSFFTLFQKIILILVNTIEDLEDIFLAELIEVNPLRGSSCPLLWTVLSLKGTICLKKGPNLG